MLAELLVKKSCLPWCHIIWCNQYDFGVIIKWFDTGGTLTYPTFCLTLQHRTNCGARKRSSYQYWWFWEANPGTWFRWKRNPWDRVCIALASLTYDWSDPAKRKAVLRFALTGWEPEARVELATCCLRNSYSTTELLRLSVNERASLARLLTTRFFLPFPLFNPAYVGVKESQLGQRRRRLLSMLLRQLPSIWSATSGIWLSLELVSAQPHRQHLFPNFLRKYRLMYRETIPKPCRPLTSPAFHFLI